jgi:hypothetical protein
MARQIVDLREDHRQRKVSRGDTPPQLAVDEIADAAGHEPQRHQRCDEVHDLEEAAAGPVCPERHRRQHAEKSAMEAHAALPDSENLQGMRRVIGGLVEDDLPEASADDHAKHAVEQQIIESLRRDAVPRLAGGPATPHDQKGDEAGQVHESVPADGQRTKADGDGIELGMDEHRSRKLVPKCRFYPGPPFS